MRRENADPGVALFAQKTTSGDAAAVPKEVLGLKAQVALDNDDDFAVVEDVVFSPHRRHVLVQALKGFLWVLGLQQVCAEDLRSQTGLEAYAQPRCRTKKSIKRIYAQIKK